MTKIEAEDQATDWKLIFLCFGSGLIAIMHLGKVSPALPQLLAELQLSRIMGGWVSSIFNVTGILLGLIAGTFSDRIGHKRVILGGLVILSVSSFLGGAAISGNILFISRIIEGVGFTAIVVGCAALTAQSASLRHRKLALMIWGTYFPVGLIIFFWISGWILEIYGWRFLWYIGGWLGAIWFAIFFIAARTDRKQRAQLHSPLSLFGNIVKTVRAPGTMAVALCFTFYSMQQLALLTWLPSFFYLERGIDARWSGAIIASTQVFNLLGNIVAWIVLNRGGRIWRTIAVCAAIMFISVLGIFSSALSDHIRLILIYTLAFFGGLIPIAVFISAPVFSPTPYQLATTNGLIVLSSSVGQIAGPPAIATVVAVTGNWNSSVIIMLSCTILILIFAILIRRTEVRLLD